MKMKKASGGRASQKPGGKGPQFGDFAKPIQEGTGGGVGQAFRTDTRPTSQPQNVTLPAPVRANPEGPGEER